MILGALVAMLIVSHFVTILVLVSRIEKLEDWRRSRNE
jgi:hypothetical protein